MDIVRFLVFNFLLHAVTVMSIPGERIGRSIANRLIALFLPMVGTMGAVGTIYRYARGEDTTLAVALRARALCMIQPAVSAPAHRLSPHSPLTPMYNVQQDPVRTPSRHREGRQTLKTISLMVTTIQGQHPFEKPGYWSLAKDCIRTPPRSTATRLVAVPWNSAVTPILSDGPATFDLAYNYSVIKIIAAISQVLYGTFQLYQSSGPQIKKGGYAAYQLTIIPYILMSLINLLASLCEPEFPALFLVRRDAPPGSTPDAISGEVGIVAPTAVEGSIHTTRKYTVCPPIPSISPAPS